MYEWMLHVEEAAGWMKCSHENDEKENAMKVKRTVMQYCVHSLWMQ